MYGGLQQIYQYFKTAAIGPSNYAVQLLRATLDSSVFYGLGVLCSTEVTGFFRMLNSDYAALSCLSPS